MPPPVALTSAEVSEPVILVGCVKTKLRRPAPAKDLYISDQFLKRRAYAEAQRRPWYILSARHGLVRPDELLGPYDVALADQGMPYRAAWGEWVAVRLEAVGSPPDGCSKSTQVPPTPMRRWPAHLAARAKLLRPLEGLRQGEQLALVQPPPPLGADIVARTRQCGSGIGCVGRRIAIPRSGRWSPAATPYQTWAVLVVGR
jgi:hypothetical protein